MGDTPILSPASVPRIAPLRLHVRTPSRSPTRNRYIDDILSDLTPVTTLEAFKSPSGRLKTSIEVATASERAFGLRAALASKNIQEWVEELSNWPWPTERGGGSLGFEVPPAKRRKLSPSTRDSSSDESANPRKDDEPEYIGSLLATEVVRYEARLDEIHADMEELNVEEIKRQVLDTHFSAKSRPSTPTSTSPMPSSLSSYAKMDDFTAIVTATVLRSLPNLSKLMRLMDVWSIRLTVLRKVPPLLLALEDAEVALRSGWNTVNNPGNSNGEDVALSRETFGVMRDVLQDKVTTLGQDLDYMLDTLEGREDTLPDTWLDRMEAIEQDYGEWVVSGDRKVREGEWAKMAKARKEAEDARRLKEEAAAKAAEEAERARLKAQEEAEEAEAAETARRKAEQAADEAERARLQSLQEAEDAKIAELSRQRVQREAEDDENARLRALQDAEDANNVELARHRAQKKAEEALAAEMARLQTLKDAEDARNAEVARQKAEKEAEEAKAAEIAREEAKNTEIARNLTLKQIEDARRAEVAKEKSRIEAEHTEAVESAKRQDEKDAEDAEMARQQAQKEADAAESARVEAVRYAEDARQAKEVEEAESQAQKDAEVAELARLQSLKDAEDARQAKQEAEDAEIARLKAQKDAEDAERDAQKAEMERQRAQKNADEAESVKRQALQESEEAEAKNQQAQMELEDAVANEAAITKATKDAEDEASRLREADTEPLELHSTHEPGELDLHVADVKMAQPAPAAGAALATEVLEKPEVDEDPSPKISRFAPFDGHSSEDSGPPLNPTSYISMAEQPTEEFFPEAASLASPIHFNVSRDRSSSRPATPNSAPSPATQPDTGSPRSPKSPHFGHALANMIRRASSPKFFSRPSSSGSTKSAKTKDSMQPREAGYAPPHSPQSPTRSSSSADWIVVDSVEDSKAEPYPHHHSVQSSSQELNLNSESERPLSKRHSRNISVVTGYATSDPTPEIQEAEPAEYFRPILSPTKAARSPANATEPTTPSRSLWILSGPTKAGRTIAIVDGSAGAKIPEDDHYELIQARAEKRAESPKLAIGVDGCGACDEALEMATLETAVIKNGIKDASILSPRRESNSSDTATTLIGTTSAVKAPSSPVASPSSPRDPLEAFPEADESPTAGRIGLRIGNAFDYSPPDSPPRGPAMSKLRSLTLQEPTRSNLDPSVPLTPLKPPVLDEVDMSPTPLASPKKVKNDDDQLQKQISTLLESIPARIRLTSEPESAPFSPFSTDTLRPKKTRRSLTPSMRSSSSMSNYSTGSYARAPTPSFTLAPAFSKTSHRTRTPGNPEIKLYHLSRSTGEAPIKLFVRLVGEHGERVMVRVGGGWADLGEYLKEYASHHGRRTAADNDRVEIQDLPPRISSNGSSYSTATLRNSGRDSPVSRPHSVLERPIDRPGSSLNIRKNRKSVGESTDHLSRPGNDVRSPSTPLPTISRASYETPSSAAPSEASSGSTGPSHRSSSRISWTEEDSSLGLAGPKSKKVVISEKDQEWVESMKEKVRLASAEKEKRNREREARETGAGAGGMKTSLGEMDRVGGTKRLFRKSGV